MLMMTNEYVRTPKKMLTSPYSRKRTECSCLARSPACHSAKYQGRLRWASLLFFLSFLNSEIYHGKITDDFGPQPLKANFLGSFSCLAFSSNSSTSTEMGRKYQYFPCHPAGPSPPILYLIFQYNLPPIFIIYP